MQKVHVLCVRIEHILNIAHIRHNSIIHPSPPDVVRGRHALARQYHCCPAQVTASPMINNQNRGIRTEIKRPYPADTSDFTEVLIPSSATNPASRSDSVVLRASLNFEGRT
jgi:hypothetical protein